MKVCVSQSELWNLHLSITFIVKNLRDGLFWFTANVSIRCLERIRRNTPRFLAPVGFFNSDLIKEGDEATSTQQMYHKSVQYCDVDIRRDLYGNIILSGSTTLYEDLSDRLKKELDALCPQRSMVNVIAQKDRYYSVWTWGSTLTSLSTPESYWTNKQEYEENGSEIVHRKCVWAYQVTWLWL